MLVGGWAAFDLDLTESVYDAAPPAIAFVVLATYVVLFLLLGSVLLPIKAVVVNFLSISASYGALVWVFQEGHLSGPLDFTPGPINTTTPIIMFCILFGLSMDYEVMLLSRIKEEYEKTGDNRSSVALGIERTGRLITGAALIMATVFFSFGLAEAVVIKAIGLGMGLAVLVDATIVRALLVPAHGGADRSALSVRRLLSAESGLILMHVAVRLASRASPRVRPGWGALRAPASARPSRGG